MDFAWDRARFTALSAGWATLPPGSTYGPRTTAFYQFLWIIEGDSEAEWDGRRFELPSGSITLIPMGTRDFYRWHPERHTQAAYIHFRFQHRPRGLPPERAWAGKRVLPDDDVLRPLMRHGMWLLDHATPAREAMLQGVLRLMLGAYLSGDVQAGAQVATHLPEPVHRAIRVMTGRIAARNRPLPTLPELARAVHLSEGHLGRLFRQAFGCGPVEAMRLVRLDEAAALLAKSNLRIQEVAELTGFANPFHFSRCFAAVFGCPPRVYRTRALAGEVIPNTRLRAVRTAARRLGRQ